MEYWILQKETDTNKIKFNKIEPPATIAVKKQNNKNNNSIIKKQDSPTELISMTQKHINKPTKKLIIND